MAIFSRFFDYTFKGIDLYKKDFELQTECEKCGENILEKLSLSEFEWTGITFLYPVVCRHCGFKTFGSWSNEKILYITGKTDDKI